MTSDPIRPPIQQIKTSEAFRKWYWPVTDLHQFCERLGLPKLGRKAELRDRIILAFDGKEIPPLPKRPKDKKIDWAKATLKPETLITKNITFGPNVRQFFKAEIGHQFICHTDFMAWVKANPGKTLADAMDVWTLMERQKEDPNFRKEIASCNTYLRYLRHLKDAHPNLTHDESKKCWQAKSKRPALDGMVIFEETDLNYLKT